MNQTIMGSVHLNNKLGTSNFFGSGLFSTSTSGGMNNNGWRRFRRNGTIPQAVLTTLHQSGIIKQEPWPLECETTVGDLLEFLKCYPYESEQERSTGDYLFQQVFKTDIPSLTKTFAQRENA
jgi:hypothetical protein